MNIRTKIDLNYKIASMTHSEFVSYAETSSKIIAYIARTMKVRNGTVETIRIHSKHCKESMVRYNLLKNIFDIGAPVVCPDILIGGNCRDFNYIPKSDIIAEFELEYKNFVVRVHVGINFLTGEMYFIYPKIRRVEPFDVQIAAISSREPFPLSPQSHIKQRWTYTLSNRLEVILAILQGYADNNTLDFHVYNELFGIGYVTPPVDFIYFNQSNQRSRSFQDIIQALRLMILNPFDKATPEQYTFPKYGFNPPLWTKITSNIKAKLKNIFSPAH